MFDFSDETERATTAWLSAHPEVAKVREAARACVGIAIPASIRKDTDRDEGPHEQSNRGGGE